MLDARSPNDRSFKVVIVGAGFGGLAAAIRLKQKGEHDFVVLERGDDVGGVWRDNRYPGCACDVQSHLYSYSFAPNSSWNYQFSPQPEILDYLRRCTQEFRILEHIQFNTAVQRMYWSEEHGEWIIGTAHGEYRGRYVFAGMGALSDPKIPAIEGMSHFKGPIFHSAQWPSDVNLEGKAVCVVGTGASAIQFVPRIQPIVSTLYLFQRTAAWVVKRGDFAITRNTRERFRRFPWWQRCARFSIYVQRELLAFGFRHPIVMRVVQMQAIRHMHASIKDTVLRRKLTPHYTLGCKRVLVSDDYYPALAQPNVHVVPSGLERVTEDGVVGSDGVEHKVDVIIFGTGFQVQDLPYSHYIYGRDNTSLADVWQGSPRSLTGTMVSDFPNLFLLHGPNTVLGHTSMVYMLETQVEQALRLIRRAETLGVAVVEAGAEAQKRYIAWVDRKLRGTVWVTAGCKSWYMDKTGRNASIWPSYTFVYRSRALNFRPEDYEFRQPSKQDESA
ncbi:NAD(P)/FAD-dependent oxidoreductase [Dyella dinghuensis]|uniref:NAD(P)/FAD-dependent oxidoreductase n=1 Tax=Dyella dinghuensis TaxID=1920169 RepID=A0A3S0RV87_9GAMM|nr:NAD(P)/FAD-dependent oxidoreductase [Dyella dinghuensis]RUL66354.1 NAD(P)/FAD-dependent oxidoreductase [Dyella dinghuensis]